MKTCKPSKCVDLSMPTILLTMATPTLLECQLASPEKIWASQELALLETMSRLLKTKHSHDLPTSNLSSTSINSSTFKSTHERHRWIQKTPVSQICTARLTTWSRNYTKCSSWFSPSSSKSKHLKTQWFNLMMCSRILPMERMKLPIWKWRQRSAKCSRSSSIRFSSSKMKSVISKHAKMCHKT